MHLRILLGLGLLALAAPARAGTLRGAVVDAQTREPLAGVTIVVSATSGAASETAISEEDGSFVVEVPAGTYLITYFYGDLTIERRDVVIGADGQVDLVQALDSSLSYDDTGCYFGPAVPFLYDGAPADHGTRAPADVPLVREPDHLALAGLDARLGPRHAATTVDGAVRLPGAPAIAGELLTEVAVASTAPAIALPGATGGTIDATLRHGSNQHRGGAALELGPRARFVARDAGALDPDHVWWSTGVVLERASGAGGASGRHGAQVMLALDAMDEPGDAPGVGVVGLATWTPDGGRDLWAAGHAGLTGDDGKRAVVIGLSAEQLTLGDGGALLERVAAPAGATTGPTAIARVAGRLGLTQRGRWRGYHTATVGGELGFGQADGAEHGDLRAYAGDEWTPRPQLDDHRRRALGSPGARAGRGRRGAAAPGGGVGPQRGGRAVVVRHRRARGGARSGSPRRLAHRRRGRRRSGERRLHPRLARRPAGDAGRPRAAGDRRRRGTARSRRRGRGALAAG
jgi:hypothetical protein